MWRKLLFRLTTAVLLLGLAGSLLYTGFYFYTTWQTDQLSSRLSRQRSDAASALAPTTTAEPARTAEYSVQTTSAAPMESVENTDAEPQAASPASTECIKNTVAEVRPASSASSSAVIAEAQAASPTPTEGAASACMETRAASPALNESSRSTAADAQTAAFPAPTGILNPAVDDTRAASPAASVAPEMPTVAPASPSPEVRADPTDDPLLRYYNALAAENPDMTGWISIADTPVDYPVMYTPEEPQYYLNRDFDRNYTVEGMPFLDVRCDAGAPSDNLIIYGHNMRSGRMFGSLSLYRDAEYRQAHPLICFDTLEERRVYRVYAGCEVQLTDSPEDADMMCYRVNLTSDSEQLQALLDYVALHALFADPEAEPKLYDQLLTLSTCTSVRRTQRFVLMAVRVE